MRIKSNPVLGSIIEISEKLEGSRLSPSVLKELEEPVSKVSEYLGADDMEALFFSLIFAVQNRDNCSVNLRHIADYLDFPFLHLLKYNFVIESLEEKSLITTKNESRRSESSGYMITESVSGSVLGGAPVPAVKKEKSDLIGAVMEVMNIENSFHKNVLDETEYKRQLVIFERKVQYIDFFRTVCEKYSEDPDSRIIIYYFAYSVVCGEDYKESPETVFSYLPNYCCIRRKKKFQQRNDILFKDRIIERYYCDGSGPRGYGDAKYRLTDNGIVSLFGKDAADYTSRNEILTELDEVILAVKEMSRIYQDRINPFDKMGQLSDQEADLKKYDYFKKMGSIIPSDYDRWVYYDCVCDFINGYDSGLSRTLRDLYGRSKTYFSELRSFLNEKHFLLESGLLEIEQNENVEKVKLMLTDKSVEILYGENADLYKRKVISSNILQPEKLKEKELFYPKEVQEQIAMLEQSLYKENLTAIQKRLEDKKLPKGLAVILYGAAGTGKTETVYQMAKKTDRKILHVDISESKSMWFGESEKRIKKIFTDYRSLCKSCLNHGENIPILLFNEADALISRRQSLENAGSVDQTENAIQNILLEEMEKLDGIMIATTNLCENMDAAFERRFLFKIRYEKPDIETRSRIWMNKLDYLSEEDASLLARDFDFSGGEIDNIVRKGEMNEIITGERPDYEKLAALCTKERLEKEGERKIGFDF